MTHTIIPGAPVGHWLVLAVDATGRRADCRCRCGTVREVSVAALVNGESTSCGCAPLTTPQLEALRQEAGQELRRRELKNWRPGD
jgi:hypothetical protein